MPQQLDLSAPPHRNHYLFSDYYLNHHVPERLEWRDVDVRAGFDAVARLWNEKQRALTHVNESQTEEDWIKPVLRLLGHHFTVQVSVQVQGGSKTPDYILCADEVSRQRVQALGHPAADAGGRTAKGAGSSSKVGFDTSKVNFINSISA